MTSALPRIFVSNGMISESDSSAIAQQMGVSNTSFLTELVKMKKVTYVSAMELLSDKFSLNMVDLSGLDIDQFPKMVDKKLMITHRILPIHLRGKKLTLAVADPTDQTGVEAIRFNAGVQVETVVAEENKLLDILSKLTESTEDALSKSIGSEDFGDDLTGIEDVEDESSADDVDDAPVVKFLHKVLLDAIAEGASDIHFEPFEKFYRIRFRVDGILREVAQPPLSIKEKLASRVKVISRLNIAEKRVPQDGRMRLVVSKTKVIDFRVSTLPTLQGEKIVLRILDPSSATLGIEALGYEPDQKACLLDAIQRPYGMVLVTGPTGSGKTVSLYTCLNILNQPGINISTAEDPAEINLPGINQVNVDDRSGLTFSAALKAFLRQDPDIIMVGEIRDLETAEISVKAAQTGHMVLSTLHTNDAPQTLTRLMNMGIPLFNIASSVILITAQRLARRLCTCKQEVQVPEDALRDAGLTDAEIADTQSGKTPLFGPNGCDRCKGSGYKGRVGIYQVMPVTEEIQRIILTGGTALDIAKQAKAEGVSDLRRSGIVKALHGMTSLDEVLATTNL